ncbi:MAG: exodeoxyribonuclease VII small subunit [Alphaproteobacteria bacterium]
MSQEATQDDIARMSFEDALAELERIVKTLESGSGKLDAAIDAYERGAALKRHCETKLREAERRIEKITLDSSGQARAEPASIG